MAGGLFMSVSQNERERAIYRSRMKLRTDLQSNLATAEDNGREKGLAEGLVKGRAERSVGIARKLLKLNLPLKQIVEAIGLTVEETERLRIEEGGRV